MWEVEVTDEFLQWWSRLMADQQESLADRVDLLAERGPDTYLAELRDEGLI